MPTSPGSVAVRGLTSGLAFGLAVATVHVAVGIALILSLGQPPLTGFSLFALAAEIVMGGILGAIASPILLAPNGRWLHPALLALVWLALERWVAVDPSKPQMWLAGPLVGSLLLALGSWLADQRWAQRLPPNPAAAMAGLAVAVNLALIAVPAMRTLASATPEAPPASRPASASGAPDVLFIVMDTVRAQSCSTYGYARETTPTLTALAADGLRFAQASAPGTWSLPAHASLFTGTFPSVHNCHDENLQLDEKLPTIAEVFRSAGYETRCFSANPHISDQFGLTRGFDACDKAWANGDGARQFTFIYRILDRLGFGGAVDKGGAMVVGNITRWMADRPADGPPAFVFVNFLEAHFPFEQLPTEFREAFQDRPIGELRDAGSVAFGAQMGRILTQEEVDRIRQPILDLYDGGVKYTDDLVRRTIDVWKAKGKLDDTVVVVLADHGEVVGEHNAFGHLSAVVEEDLRVPLVFRYPKKVPAGLVVAHPVSTAGVFATVAELAGVQAPPTVMVGSLLRALPDTSTCTGLVGDAQTSCVAESERAASEAGLPVIAERFEHHVLSGRFSPGTANGVGPEVNPHSRYRTYRSGDYKLVQHCTDGSFLFDLRQGEQQDIAQAQPEKLAALEGELLQWAVALKLPSMCGEVARTAVPAKAMSKEETCSLCALGYLDGEQCDGCP